MCRDEMMDEELAGMVNYTDETVPAEMPVMEREEELPWQAAADTEGAAEKSRPAVYIRKRTDLQRIGSGLKWLLPCGVVAWILWQFWMNDLMAMEAAYPCIFVCGCIGAGGFFWNARA